MIRFTQGLSKPLPLLVTRSRTKRIHPSLIGLRGREHFRVTVSFTRRREENPRIILSRQLQHLLSPFRVRKSRFHRMLLVILWCWPTCQVEDHVNFRVSRVGTHVRFFELEALRSLEMLNVLEDSCREVVQADDFRSYSA